MAFMTCAVHTAILGGYVYAIPIVLLRSHCTWDYHNATEVHDRVVVVIPIGMTEGNNLITPAGVFD